MTIEIGENPEGMPRINKFIAKSGDGLRGKIIAISDNEKQAVVLAMNSAFAGDFKWGKLYLVKESSPAKYPVVKQEVSGIPNDKNWRIV